MKKYAQIINEETKECSVGLGTNSAFYKSIGMTEMDVEQAYNGQWYLSGYAPAKPQPTPEEIVKGYEDAIQAHLDATAQSRGYDNTYTCLSYLSSTDEKWNRESHAFNEWRDAVWTQAHEILNAFIAGTIEQPTIEEVIAQLPAIDWNDPDEE